VRLIFDTNRYSDFARGVREVVSRFESADELCLSIIVLGELRGGFAVGSRRRENEGKFERFLARPNVKVLNLDETTTEHYAIVYKDLRRQGTKIPTNDMWIAAQALQHVLNLDTRDKHFKHVPGLKLVE
jgi:tRNA(fMet)-specific endonuclease VapC